VPLLEEDLGARRAQPALARDDHRHHQQLVWIEDIVRMAETQASCELYGLLKRPTKST
jgi:GTP cyclohydrolase FolE2